MRIGGRVVPTVQRFFSRHACSGTDHVLVAPNERLGQTRKGILSHPIMRQACRPCFIEGTGSIEFLRKKEITFASTHTPAIKPRNGVDTLPSMRISTRSPKFRAPCRLAQNEFVWAVLPNYISDSPIKQDFNDVANGKLPSVRASLLRLTFVALSPIYKRRRIRPDAGSSALGGARV